MLDADPVGHVLDVTGDHAQWRLHDEVAVTARHHGVEDDSDEPTGIADGVELAIGEVARNRAQGVRSRVRHDERGARQLGGLEEAALVEMQLVLRKNVVLILRIFSERE